MVGSDFSDQSDGQYKACRVINSLPVCHVDHITNFMEIT
jgi:hypothetical protein